MTQIAVEWAGPEPRGDWIMMRYLDRFFFEDPREEDFRIEDIAHHLAMIPRFAGAAPWHYSVAQHCVLMSAQVPQEFAKEALLHDRAEAYLLDMPRPIKHILPDYQRLEWRIMERSAKVFGVPVEMSPVVKEADNRMLVTEARQFFRNRRPEVRWWEDRTRFPAPYPDLYIQQWTPEYAYTAFMNRWRTLA